MSNPLSISALLLVAPLLAASASDDWPQYNGAAGNRRSAQKLVVPSWSDKAPGTAWRVPTQGGFSSFVVANGRAFSLVTRAGAETCVALDAKTGQELWARELDSVSYDGGGDRGTDDNSGGDGPRSTPSHADGRVYVLDSSLGLYCLDEVAGKVQWMVDLVAKYGGRNIRWQNAASPLIEGAYVFVAGGGEGQSLLAFDRKTGELAWKSGDELMTHATPVAATIHGVRQILFYVQSGVVSVVPETGEELWRFDYPFRVSSAASPVVFEDVVYVSAGYGVGGGAFVISKDGDGFSAANLWHERNGLMNHWSTPVCKDGFLYGMFSFKEYGDGPLECVELATGTVSWSKDGFGPGNVILVGNTLVALSDAGEVVLVEANPVEYEEQARARVLDGKCWSTPAFADGSLFVRSTTEGVRLDLAPAR